MTPTRQSRSALGALMVAATVVALVVGGRASAAEAFHGSVTALGPACEEMEAVVAASPIGHGTIDWPTVPPAPPVNGDLVSMAFGPDDHTNLMVIPLDGAPLDRITTWPTYELPFAGIAVRGDGAALAVPFYFGNGCADVLVLSSDGTTARRPFRDRVPEAVLDPEWSPDGSLLAVEGSFGRDASGTLLSVPGSVWTWEPATDTIRDLGRPCADCWLGQSGSAWSPDGARLAVPYTGGRCGRFLHTTDDPTTVDPQASFAPPCMSPGLALVDPDGTWVKVTPTPDLTAFGYFNLVGWLDDHTLALEDGSGAGVRLDVDTGTWTPIRFPSGGVVLSPDRRRAVMEDGDGGAWWLDVMDLASGATTRIDTIGEPAFAWSPDSTSLAIVTATADGARRGIYLAPANGSSPATLLRLGPYGPAAWLPASPRAGSPSPSIVP